MPLISDSSLERRLAQAAADYLANRSAPGAHARYKARVASLQGARGTSPPSKRLKVKPAAKARRLPALDLPANAFGHLRPGAADTTHRGVPDARPDHGRVFAERGEAITARIEQREPRALVAGPTQATRLITGADLNAALRAREKQQDGIVARRRGIVGG